MMYRDYRVPPLDTFSIILAVGFIMAMVTALGTAVYRLVEYIYS